MELTAVMKKNLLNVIFIALPLIIILPSCSKTDSTINAVATNSSPAAKQISFVGPAGLSNNLVYYGNAGPDSSVGCFGDYFLNTSKGLLYGPRSIYGWGNGLAMKGATSAENQVYSGTGSPDASLGNTGDYYLDTRNFLLYGAKTESGWGSALNLQHQPG